MVWFVWFFFKRVTFFFFNILHLKNSTPPTNVKQNTISTGKKKLRCFAVSGIKHLPGYVNILSSPFCVGNKLCRSLNRGDETSYSFLAKERT